MEINKTVFKSFEADGESYSLQIDLTTTLGSDAKPRYWMLLSSKNFNLGLTPDQVRVGLEEMEMLTSQLHLLDARDATEVGFELADARVKVLEGKASVLPDGVEIHASGYDTKVSFRHFTEMLKAVQTAVDQL